LEGHFDVTTGPEAISRQSLFKYCQRKTIIMLGNVFPYFERGRRCALDLVDEKELMPALRNGAAVIVSNVERWEWATIHVPRLLRSTSFSCLLEFKTIKKLVSGILHSPKGREFFDTRFICQPKRIGNDTQRCFQKATRAAAELVRKVPALRFIVIWTPFSGCSGERAGTAGKVEVLPCLSYNSKMLFTRDTDIRSDEISAFCILLSQQLRSRLEMFWLDLANDIPNRILFNVMEYDLVMEMARFANPHAPWPDCIPRDKLLSSLERVQAFLTYDLDRQFCGSSLARMVSILGNLKVLADCCVGSWPRAFTFGTRRKALNSALTKAVKTFFQRHYSQSGEKSISRQFSEYVAKQTRKLKAIDLLERKAVLIKQIMTVLNVGVSENTNIYDPEMWGNVVLGPKEENFRISHTTQIKYDVNYAKHEVQEMSI
jgi:hypothetical protein